MVTFEPSAAFRRCASKRSRWPMKSSHSCYSSPESLLVTSSNEWEEIAVDPGIYNVVCNTNTGEQWHLVSDIEVRAGYLTVVRPQTLVGKVQVDELTRPGFPKFKVAQLVPAGEIDGGMIHGSPRQTTTWGVPFPILGGNTTSLSRPKRGDHSRPQWSLEVVPGGTAVVKTNDEIAAIVVRPEAIEDLEIETIRVHKHGSNYYIQEVAAAGQPILVYARDEYDVVLKQPKSVTTLKQKLTPLRGALTLIAEWRRVRHIQRRRFRRPGHWGVWPTARRRDDCGQDVVVVEGGLIAVRTVGTNWLKSARPAASIGDRRRGRRREAKHNVEQQSTPPDRLA